MPVSLAFIKMFKSNNFIGQQIDVQWRGLFSDNMGTHAEPFNPIRICRDAYFANKYSVNLHNCLINSLLGFKFRNRLSNAFASVYLFSANNTNTF